MDKENMVKVEIFDPPMCCPGGLCGPSIDPALLDVQEALLRIQQEFDGGARAERYLLSQQPARFMQNPEVLSLLKAKGVSVLPITAINGKVVKTGAYPSYTELKGWLKNSGV